MTSFSPLLVLTRLRVIAQPILTPIEYCFDHHEAIRAGHVPSSGTRLTLEVRSKRALDATMVKSDTAKMTIRWGDRPGEWVDIEPGTGRMATLADIIEDAARGLDSVASISAAAGIAASALRALPLPAIITFEDPLAHTRIYEDSEVDPALLSPVTTSYERSWDDIVELGLSSTFLTYAPAITSLEEARAALAPLLRSARRVVAFTGAGVSVESGVPSYRGCGPASLWENFTEEDASLPRFMGDPNVRARYWQIKTYFYSIILKAQPNAAHLTLGQLTKEGRLHAVVTQNIDGLHERGGVPPSKVINLHGTEDQIKCYSCGHIGDRLRVHNELVASTDPHPLPPPQCACGDVLRPTTIMFGQPLEPETLAAAKKAVDEADLLLVMGCSLVVQPANTLPTRCIVKGVPVVVVNPLGETFLDPYAHLLLRVPAGQLLNGILS